MKASPDALRVVWLARTFLHYRIPVFRALQRQCGGGLRVVCSADDIPADVLASARAALGDALIALRGEWQWGAADRHFMANRNLSVRLHPGLPALLRRLAPAVVISDGFFKWTTAALWHRWRTRTPLVVAYERTAHTERHAQALRIAYRRFVVRRTAAMACTGSLSRAYAEQVLRMPAARIVAGHMVADVPAFSAAAAAASPTTRAAWRERWAVAGFVAVCVGRLLPAKGCMELLRGWDAFAQRCPGRGTLVFVGDGPADADLRAYAEQHRVTSVRFAGRVAYADLAAVYAAADLLIMPTLEDNWSLVVAEAMACGLPVACSVYNGCHPELVQPGRNGWIFDPLCGAAVQTMLDRVCADVNAFSSMGAASRTIISGHTPEHAATALLRACRLACEVAT